MANDAFGETDGWGTVPTSGEATNIDAQVKMLKDMGFDDENRVRHLDFTKNGISHRRHWGDLHVDVWWGWFVLDTVALHVPSAVEGEDSEVLFVQKARKWRLWHVHLYNKLSTVNNPTLFKLTPVQAKEWYLRQLATMWKRLYQYFSLTSERA